MEFTSPFFILLLRCQFYYLVGRNNISALLINLTNEKYHNQWHDDFLFVFSFFLSLPPLFFFFFLADDSIKSQVEMIDATWSPYATEHSTI
ncbi:hypothetical protein I7I48_05601 [Histoplasma ohiense]|nr:hypothetical protein I7I48_05601 [Histoplasma ohiense (nom. inval.)]